MRFIFYSPVAFEEWDHQTPDNRGIGASEVAHIEMAQRLASRGHDVISYAPIFADSIRDWKGVTWKPREEVDPSLEGIWILYRCPDFLDKFPVDHPNQQLWLVQQDEWYSTWTGDRFEKADRIVALCMAHAEESIIRAKEVTGVDISSKVCISSNGLKCDLIREIERTEVIHRNPHKLIYASSPDRGLLHLLKIFGRAREVVSDLQLHVFYGFDNIDKLIAGSASFKHYAKIKSEIEPLLNQPGVHWRGRVSQPDLYREWFSAGIWCYPTNFTETSCCTCMEAQSMGAIPITAPIWALRENIQHGFFLEGDAYNDKLVQARYAGEIVRLASNIALQESIRAKMMMDARYLFNWDRWVDQWERWASGLAPELPWAPAQYNYQIKWATGRILNVGCDVDLCQFGKRGAINLDMFSVSHNTGIKTAAHLLGDARKLPVAAEFDTVILGDILEHMTDEDAVRSLRSAKTALRAGGRIVVTVPDDHRPDHQQHSDQKTAYGDGESTYHVPVPFGRLKQWIEEAELRVINYESLDYTFAEGHGVVCV